MFGAFELTLPSELNTRLSQVGGKGFVGAFLMGLVAGLIAAPCTGPPLAALLLFVGTQQSVVLGGSLLFVYALGMGLLFFAIAGFALTLPKSGAWMDAIKHMFGVIMLVAALYFARNLLAPLRDYGKSSLTFLGIHGALMAAGIAFGGLRLAFSAGVTSAARKSLGILLLTIGLFGSVSWFLAPRAVGITWLRDESQAVAQATRERKPLLIDFGAEWCLPCKEMERRTFADPAVQRELARFVLVRIDCTEGSEGSEALQKKYDSETLPSVILFNRSGEKVLKISEFTPPDKLLPILQQIQ
jgi:thiol:disulfide interchange protein DsbD